MRVLGRVLFAMFLLGCCAGAFAVGLGLGVGARVGFGGPSSSIPANALYQDGTTDVLYQDGGTEYLTQD